MGGENSCSVANEVRAPNVISPYDSPPLLGYLKYLVIPASYVRDSNCPTSEARRGRDITSSNCYDRPPQDSHRESEWDQSSSYPRNEALSSSPKVFTKRKSPKSNELITTTAGESSAKNESTTSVAPSEQVKKTFTK